MMVRNSSLTLAVVVGLVLAAVPAAADQQEAPAARLLDSLEPGDVLAVGEAQGTSCHFAEPAFVEIRAPRNLSGTIHSSIELDGDCRAILAEKSTMRHSDPPDARGGAGGSFVDSTRAIEPENDLSPRLVQPSSQGSKTVNNRVYHYGSGGHDDMLTQVTDEVTYSYDGSEATILNSQPVSCTATGSWVIDACTTDSISSPGNPAYKKSHGDFHRDTWWSSPDYYHTLRSYTGGYGSGQSYCVYGWEGTIASGVSNDCTVS